MFNKITNGVSKPIKASNAVKPKLFSAYSIIDDFCGHGRVKVHWFYCDRIRPIIPYELLIQNYQPGDAYTENCINEFFTEYEIDLLREYLWEFHGDKLYPCKVSLPIFEKSAPFSAIGTSSTINFDPKTGEAHFETTADYYELFHEEEYTLPFRVEGYFDLEAHFTCASCSQKIFEEEAVIEETTVVCKWCKEHSGKSISEIMRQILK
jgi:hypothetical protein